jgi:hypothetical protein
MQAFRSRAASAQSPSVSWWRGRGGSRRGSAWSASKGSRGDPSGRWVVAGWCCGVEVDSEGLDGLLVFVLPLLDEKQRRLVAGAMACFIARAGPTMVARSVGDWPEHGDRRGEGVRCRGGALRSRVRREGGGGPRLEDTNPNLLMDLDHLVSVTRGVIRCRRCVGRSSGPAVGQGAGLRAHEVVHESSVATVFSSN